MTPESPDRIPYVGAQPFTREESDLFFGRGHESREVLDLTSVHPVVLVYAQSGAGKTSLLHAKLIPLLEEEGCEVLPVARVRGVIPKDIQAKEIPNIYVFNTLMSWAEGQTEPKQLAQMSLADFLHQRVRRTDDEGLPALRVIIFDQFEELVTFHPERWRDREGFFTQIGDVLEGSPALLRAGDLKAPARLLDQLRKDQHPLSRYLRTRLPPSMQTLLDADDDSTLTAEALQTVVEALNGLIRGASLYEPRAFAQIPLTEATQNLIAQKPRGAELHRLHRFLLDETFPGAIVPSVAGDPRLRVVFVMREEYIAPLSPYAMLLPEKLRTRFRLECLREEAALEAVTKPLQGTGRSFSKDAAEKLVQELMKIQVATAANEVIQGPGQVPGEFVEPMHLQLVCQKLWQGSRNSTEITWDPGARNFGDVGQVLSEFYEGVIKASVENTNVKEGPLRRWFEHMLITPAGTRGTVYRDKAQETTAGVPNATVDVLEELHLIRVEWRGDAQWYELTHDRFIEPIRESNWRWRNQRVGGSQQILADLEDKAKEWAKANARAKVGRLRGHGKPLKGVDLDKAVRLLDSPEADELGCSDMLKSFVESSKEARTSLRQKLWLAGLVAVILILIVALGSAYYSSREAETSSREASARKWIAAAQTELGKGSKHSAALLALAAAFETSKDQKILPEAKATLLQIVQAVVPPYNLVGHTDAVFSVAFSPNGTRLATASADRTVKVWELNAGTWQERRTLEGHRDAVQSVAFSPDGARLATASADGTVKVWDVNTGRSLHHLANHTGAVQSVAFSPDGTLLATASADRTVKVWDAATGKELKSFQAHQKLIRSVAFSPNNTRLATASDDGMAKVWDASTTDYKELFRLKGHGDAPLGSVAFNRDGTRLTTSSADGTVQVWDATTGEELKSFQGHKSPVISVTFSPDSDRLATASYDGMAKVWDATTYKELLTLEGHKDRVLSVAFSPDGTRSPRPVRTVRCKCGIPLLGRNNRLSLGTLSQSLAWPSARMEPASPRPAMTGR